MEKDEQTRRKAARQRRGGEERSEKREIDYCRQNLVQPVPDTNCTVRAWRAVVTYLMRRQEFRDE